MWLRTGQASRLLRSISRDNTQPRRMADLSSIRALQRAFRDPSSPFYLRDGEVGPASPDELPRLTQPVERLRPILPDALRSLSSTSAERTTITSSEPDFPAAAVAARAHALSEGHDPDSFFEQKVVWGDLDSFRHLNNTRYVRFLESSRVQWITRLAEEVGGPALAATLLEGRGIGIILKSLSVNFKRPVLYPDTLLISHRPRAATPPSPTQYHEAASIYSYAQRAVVATSDSVLVWYDYEQLRKSSPTEGMRVALERRIRHGEGQCDDTSDVTSQE